MGGDGEKFDTARFDGVTLFLPETIDAFPSADLNRKLYLWLAALAVAATPGDTEFSDPLRRDIARLRRALADGARATQEFPGLAPIRDALAAQTLALRPPFKGPPVETELESWIRARLAGEPLKFETPLERALAGDATPCNPCARQRITRPTGPLRCGASASRRLQAPARRRDDDAPEPGGQTAEGAEKTLKAERRKSDQSQRRDSLILHRFESILSFADFLNVNRDVDDDDENSARKAAADAEKIGVAPTP